MSLLATTDDAEQFAKGWMERRYGKKLGKVKFVEVMSEGDIWMVKANVRLATGVLSIKPHVVQLRINASSNEVMGYSETEVSEKGD